MGYTISIGGKGGTGKTTVAGLIVRYLVRHGMKPVLVVDADPNTNLNEVLGVEIRTTLSDARERMKKDVPTGMTKDIFMQIQMEEALVEAEGFDLIAMGRPEGPGCYCAANSILSELLDKLMKHYPYMVIDNEAGMEHFSRLTQKDIDLLLLVSDPSKRGLTAACRIAEMVKELPIRLGEQYLIVNQIQTPPSRWPDDVKRIFGDNIVTFPADPLITEFDLQGRPTFELPDDAPIVQASIDFLDRIFSDKEARLSSGVKA